MALTWSFYNQAIFTEGYFSHTRSYHSSNRDTDHFLVFCKLKLQVKKFYRIKQPGKSRIDTNKMSKPELVQ